MDINTNKTKFERYSALIEKLLTDTRQSKLDWHVQSRTNKFDNLVFQNEWQSYLPYESFAATSSAGSPTFVLLSYDGYSGKDGHHFETIDFFVLTTIDDSKIPVDISESDGSPIPIPLSKLFELRQTIQLMMFPKQTENIDNAIDSYLNE